MEQEVFRYITQIIGWLSSLGATGIFIVFLITRKVTRGLLRVAIILLLAGAAFWLWSGQNPIVWLQTQF